MYIVCMYPCACVPHTFFFLFLFFFFFFSFHYISTCCVREPARPIQGQKFLFFFSLFILSLFIYIYIYNIFIFTIYWCVVIYRLGNADLNNKYNFSIKMNLFTLNSIEEVYTITKDIWCGQTVFCIFMPKII